jgi:hypothetical protein
MKYALRFVWYVLRIVIVAASAFAILIAAFFVAMDSANVYVIVTDGMKAHASSVLIPDNTVDLTNYFTDNYISSKAKNTDSSQYDDYVISDFDYKLNVESLWCNPWKNTATVTVVESIPKMVYTSANADTDTDSDTTKKQDAGPKWQRARYKVSCIRIDDVWRINSIEKLEDLQAEPTPTPEPSSYITASPLPSSTASSTSTSSSSTPMPTATK